MNPRELFHGLNAANVSLLRSVKQERNELIAFMTVVTAMRFGKLAKRPERYAFPASSLVTRDASAAHATLFVVKSMVKAT